MADARRARYRKVCAALRTLHRRVKEIYGNFLAKVERPPAIGLPAPDQNASPPSLSLSLSLSLSSSYSLRLRVLTRFSDIIGGRGGEHGVVNRREGMTKCIARKLESN